MKIQKQIDWKSKLPSIIIISIFLGIMVYLVISNQLSKDIQKKNKE